MTGFHRKRRRTRRGPHVDPTTAAPPPASDPPTPPPQRPHRPPRIGSPADMAAAVSPAATTPDIADTEPTDTPTRRPRPNPPPAEDRETERGLRGLVGSGTSQVPVTAALRARDAARPTPDDLTTAETNLTIIRRHWTPRD